MTIVTIQTEAVGSEFCGREATTFILSELNDDTIWAKSSGCMYQFESGKKKSLPPSSSCAIRSICHMFGISIFNVLLRIDSMSLIWYSQVHQKIISFLSAVFDCVLLHSNDDEDDRPIRPIILWLCVHKYTTRCEILLILVMAMECCHFEVIL